MGTMVGLAVEDVTPKAAVRVGYFPNGSPVTAHYHVTEAKALAISEQGPPVVLVTVDFGTPCAEISERIYAKVAPLGLAKHQVIINASHTHSGPPVCTVDLVSQTDAEKKYQTFFVDTVAKAIERALKDMKPAAIATVDGQCDICMNRRKPPTYWITPNPDGPIDRRIRLLLVKDPQTDKLRAALSLFACHPSDIQDAASFGADFFGFARDEVAKTFPDLVLMTAQGSAGDIRIAHLKPDGMTFDGSNSTDNLQPNKEFGRQYGAAIVAALGKKPEPVHGRIRAGMTELMAPLQPAESKTVAMHAASGERDMNWGSGNTFYMRWGNYMLDLYAKGAAIPMVRPYEIRMVHFGDDLTIAALNGEIFTCISQQIEKSLARSRTFVLGYSNAISEYIPCGTEIRQGGYEVEVFWWGLQTARWDPSLDQVIVKGASALSQKLLGE